MTQFFYYVAGQGVWYDGEKTGTVIWVRIMLPLFLNISDDIIAFHRWSDLRSEVRVVFDKSMGYIMTALQVVYRGGEKEEVESPAINYFEKVTDRRKIHRSR